MNPRVIGAIAIGGVVALLLCLLAVPMMVLGGSSMLFSGGGAGGCVAGSSGTVAQPGVSSAAANSIPANYLTWYRKVGQQYGVPWTVLAGIGKVESDHGRTTLPGVTSGANAFGAAGPMQIGIEGAAGDQWSAVATVEDGKPPASVYDPADAIAGAAKYLIAHGVQTNVQSAIFAYNHLDSYVTAVLGWASTYASGGFTVSATSLELGVQCDLGRVHRHRNARLPDHAQRGRRHRDQLRAGPAGQAVPVGRHRAGRVRLLGAGHDGLPGGRHQHPAYVRGPVGTVAARARRQCRAG